MLDLSPHITDVLLDLAALHPSSVFIGISRDNQDVLPNCLLINKQPNLSNLKKLYETDHFDIAYIGGGLTEITNRFEYIKLFAKIADHVVLTLDIDLVKLIPEFLSEINAFSTNINSDQNKQQTYLIKNKDTRNITPFPNSNKIEISSNFHYKIGIVGQSANPWPMGISLFSFKLLNGVVPNPDVLADQLQNSDWQQKLTLPYCAFLQGNQIYWHPVIPHMRVWPKEGLASCIKGMQIPQDQYESYCQNEFRRLLLPN
ncbi:MAG: hypothetical protein H7A40_04715 [Chlamydiales bacterium]|nr:hypothetical protein [Chlamydiales bacterium]